MKGGQTPASAPLLPNCSASVHLQRNNAMFSPISTPRRRPFAFIGADRVRGVKNPDARSARLSSRRRLTARADTFDKSSCACGTARSSLRASGRAALRFPIAAIGASLATRVVRSRSRRTEGRSTGAATLGTPFRTSRGRERVGFARERDRVPCISGAAFAPGERHPR